jgi:hypothetical protein
MWSTTLLPVDWAFISAADDNIINNTAVSVFFRIMIFLNYSIADFIYTSCLKTNNQCTDANELTFQHKQNSQNPGC